MKNPPEEAGEKILSLSAEGHSIVGIAQRFDVSKDTFVRWMEDYPELKAAFDQGREKERHTLHNMLYTEATLKRNTVAAMFLLKARHGYREGDQGDSANKVTINFQLPGAMPLDDFLTVTTTAKEIDK